MRKNYFHLISILIILILIGCKSDKSKEQTANTTVPAKLKHIRLQTYNFEKGLDGWGGRGVVKTTQFKKGSHTGNGCLKIEGTAAPQAWNFAGCSRINLKPNTQYELRGWMNVESIDGEVPFFKVEWAKPEGGVMQVSSTLYNLGAKNKWQELNLQFQTPSKPVVMYLAVEKRPHGKNVRATIYLDDIIVDQLQ
jgi:hypothetical protein